MWRQKPVGFEQWINKKSHREKSGKSGGLVVRRTGFCCAECARYVSADCPTESMSLLAGYCKSPLRCNNLNNNFFRALIRHHLFTMKRNALFGASLSVNLALCANSGAVLVVPNYADQISRSENKWIHPVYQNWCCAKIRSPARPVPEFDGAPLTSAISGLGVHRFFRRLAQFKCAPIPGNGNCRDSDVTAQISPDVGWFRFSSLNANWTP